MWWNLDNLLVKICDKLPFLNTEGQTWRYDEIGTHVFSGLAWALFWAQLCRYSKWCWLSLPLWIAWTWYKELLVDGHLWGILHGTDSSYEIRDFISDIITKHIGLIGYLMYFLKR